MLSVSSLESVAIDNTDPLRDLESVSELSVGLEPGLQHMHI